MKKINSDQLLDHLIEGSANAFSPERFIGTVKIRCEDKSLTEFYILFFDSYCSFSQDDFLPMNDKVFALVHDRSLNSLNLCSIKFEELHALCFDPYLRNRAYWDDSSKGRNWWPIYHRIRQEMFGSDSSKDFYWKLDSLHRSCYDDLFDSFAHCTGYFSVVRDKYSEMAIEFKDDRISLLEERLAHYEVKCPDCFDEDVSLPF